MCDDLTMHPLYTTKPKTTSKNNKALVPADEGEADFADQLSHYVGRPPKITYSGCVFIARQFRAAGWVSRKEVRAASKITDIARLAWKLAQCAVDEPLQHPHDTNGIYGKWAKRIVSELATEAAPEITEASIIFQEAEVGSIGLRNTAGMKEFEATKEIALELLAARIPPIVVPEPVGGVNFHSECTATITGRLEPFVLRRAWVYWIVSAPVRQIPYEIAKEIYEDPRDKGGAYGNRGIRVGGSCVCPEPTGPVGCYHVDTVDGLKLIVEILRKHGLVNE